MGTNQVLAECRRRGVSLSVRDGRLAWRAPLGAMTANLRAALDDHRDAILTRLGVTAPVAVPEVPERFSRGTAHPGPAYRANLWAEPMEYQSDRKHSLSIPTPQVPEVPDVPEVPHGFTPVAPRNSAGDGPVISSHEYRPTQPRATGTTGTSGIGCDNSLPVGDFRRPAGQGWGGHPSGTSGTDRPADLAGGLTTPTSVTAGLRSDPPPWRLEVAGWPPDRWAAWRALASATLARLPGPPSADDVVAADRDAYRVVAGPAIPRPCPSSAVADQPPPLGREY